MGVAYNNAIKMLERYKELLPNLDNEDFSEIDVELSIEKLENLRNYG